LKTSLANFYFRSVCIKLVALRLNWYQEVAFSVKKVGDPSCTSIIKLYAVCFWIRGNQRYSKVSYISTRNKSWLDCGLSHVQLWYSHCYKKIAFPTVYHTG